MADSSLSKLPSSYHARSSSLPARLHPSAKKIDEELTKFRSFELSSSPNSRTIFTSLSGLTDLYKFIVDLFNLPAVQHALAQHQLKHSMNQLLDVSLRCLDVCSMTRDATSRMKESVRELQSALRRKKVGDLSIESYINAYVCSRKKIKGEISNSLLLLKEMAQIFSASPPLDDLDYQPFALVKMLREAIIVTGFIFRWLLSFLSAPVLKPKPKRWASVLKLVIKDQTRNANELEVMEADINKLLLQKDGETERIQSILSKLEEVDVTIENIENYLECLFRRMIQARVSLLNILSM